MNHMNRILALAVSLALGASLLTGCSSGDSSSSAGSASSSAASSAQAVEPMDLTGITDPYMATAGVAGDAVMGAIGQYDIPAADVLYWLNYGAELYLSQAAMYGSTGEVNWEEELEGVPLSESLMNSAIETAAFYRLLPEKAAEAGLTLSQEDKDLLQADIDAGVAELGSEQAMEHMMWYQMSTLDHYSRTYEVTVLYNDLMEYYFGEGGQFYPTDAEVKAYAEDEQGAYRAKHILLLTKDMTQQVTNEDGTVGYAPLDEETVAQKKALADDIVAQLKASDDPIALFDELMHEHSEDTGLPYYPDGYDTYKGQMVAAFEETALALKEGEISGVVESPDYGYHIILRLPINLDAFREDYAAQLMVELTDQWMADAEFQGNELCDQVDLSDFRAKVESLQAAVAAEMEAIEAAKAEAAGSSSPSSSSAG